MRTPTVFLPSGSFDQGSQNPWGPRGFLRFRNSKTNLFSEPKEPLFSRGAEAAPFYTGITVKRSGSGTRSWDSGSYVVTQTINYSVEQTFNRLSIADQEMEEFISNYNLWNGGYDYFSYDGFIGSSTYTNESSTYIRHWLANDRGFSDPKKHHLLFNGKIIVSPLTYGSEKTVYDSGTPAPTTTDLITYGFEVKCPFFFQSDSDLAEFDKWNCEIGLGEYGSSISALSDSFGIDVTGYSATKWRDLRGSYLLTVNDSDLTSHWDSNSVVHKAEWTIF